MKTLPFVTGHLALAIDGHHDHAPGGVVELDEFGRPVLDYPLTPSLFEAFREAHRRIVTLQLEQGARRVYTMHDPPRPIRSRADLSILDELPYAPNRLFVTTAHQMGGAGMSDAPESGVVRSEDLRHHQLTNLHVVDGSVFPTSLGVNPQLTIFGLARVMAARLADAWA